MVNKTNLPYPKDEYVELLKDFCGSINGMDCFDPVKEWNGDKWSATVHCSRGKVLEKAGFSRVHMVGGMVNESPADLSLFETLVYPANPTVPGFIIMTNMNSSEAMGSILVLYLDLIIQDGKPHEREKSLFADAVKRICGKHGHDADEYKGMMAGGRLLGGNAGQCGLLNFFEEKDMPLLEDLIKEILPVYKNIVEHANAEQPRKEDYEMMNKSRARMIEWIILEDYGTRVARENGIASEAIESYGFPPVIRY
jgi:coproporphyrinogen III oxidase